MGKLRKNGQPRYRSRNALISRAYRTYQRNAKNRGIEWDLSREQFIIISTGDCVYCGGKPANSAASWEGKNSFVLSPNSGGDFIFNGIDRVDNKKGYIKNNVVACCKECNYLKGKLSQEELLWRISEIIPRLVKQLMSHLKKYP